MRTPVLVGPSELVWIWGVSPQPTGSDAASRERVSELN